MREAGHLWKKHRCNDYESSLVVSEIRQKMSSHISKILAGSDVPCVTERNVFPWEYPLTGFVDFIAVRGSIHCGCFKD